MELLSWLRSPYLLGLIGHCSEGGQRLLVYEFMANGGLQEHLYPNRGKPILYPPVISMFLSVWCCVQIIGSISLLVQSIKTPNLPGWWCPKAACFNKLVQGNWMLTAFIVLMCYFLEICTMVIKLLSILCVWLSKKENTSRCHDLENIQSEIHYWCWPWASHGMTVERWTPDPGPKPRDISPSGW